MARDPSDYYKRELKNFRDYLVSIILRFEERESMYIRRVLLYLNGSKFKLVVNKQRNRWADDKGIIESEMASKAKFESWVRRYFAGFWMRQRICKFLLDFDIRHGGVSMKMYDWGVQDVPDPPEFKNLIVSLGRDGAAQDRKGFLYENPDLWTDADIDTPVFKPLSVLIQESEAIIDAIEKPSFDIYEPPEQEA